MSEQGSGFSERVNQLFSSEKVRQRSNLLFDEMLAGKGKWQLDLSRLPALADFVVQVIRKNYPHLKVPYHSRFGHFRAGGIDRVIQLHQWMDRLKIMDLNERARVELDLVIPSVLLDAGAGPHWKYLEASSGQEFSRSEGLGVASFWMFMAGKFAGVEKPSADSTPAQRSNQLPLRTTPHGLLQLSEKELSDGFQVSEDRPLVGLRGRLELLHALARSLKKHSSLFRTPAGDIRPGGLFDLFPNREVSAPVVLQKLLHGLSEIWPNRLQLDGAELGDTWKHPLLEELDRSSGSPFQGLIPFHKLSQWMTYSTLEVFERAGKKVVDLDGLTGLPEYRNGGLFVDGGVLRCRDPQDALQSHLPGSALIVEWRAATVVLLDRIAPLVRERLGVTEAQMPLAQILEGGTWWAGRALANEKRPQGEPPIRIQSDGTVF